MTDCLFNLAFLRETTDGDAALEADLMLRFQTTLSKCLHQLRQSAEAWEAALHELRGAASVMGAKALAEHCAKGEFADFSAQEAAEYIAQLDALANQTLTLMTQSLAA